MFFNKNYLILYLFIYLKINYIKCSPSSSSSRRFQYNENENLNINSSNQINEQLNNIYISENNDIEALGILTEQMSKLDDKKVKILINLLKIIRKNKKEILEIFLNQRLFNQFINYVENNKIRIQLKKKNKQWVDSLLKLKENNFEGILETINICENLNNYVFRAVLFNYCKSTVKEKIDNIFKLAKINIEVNLNKSINNNQNNNNEINYNEQEIENIIFNEKKKKFISIFNKTKTTLSRGSSSSFSSVSSFRL
ncbi:hypothetical protein Mgra_00001551 [Meloidogyne graminicola]|uniref:Uncharacterized protein n=1 Tax=Meloidogyne graminicola TaxID=189291 RepID=A0A8T0A0T9_9BILA|nr:hypothetical protein Mgra_00001551 [Meloidogyne graminicola]